MESMGIALFGGPEFIDVDRAGGLCVIGWDCEGFHAGGFPEVLEIGKELLESREIQRCGFLRRFSWDEVLMHEGATLAEARGCVKTKKEEWADSGLELNFWLVLPIRDTWPRLTVKSTSDSLRPL